MDFSQPYIVISFFIILAVVAFMYASVGHGGASGYLALMSLFAFSTIVMKPSALLLFGSLEKTNTSVGSYFTPLPSPLFLLHL
jgi:hypothetical protein